MSNGRPFPDDLLSAYRDGELTAAECEAAARLLEDSADARTEWEDYQALAELLRSLPDEKAPDGLRALVMRRIERESLLATTPATARPARRPSRRFWIVGTLLAGSAAGLLVAFAALRERAAQFGDRPVASAPAPVEPSRGLDRPLGAARAELRRSSMDVAASSAGRTLEEAEHRLGEESFGMTAAAQPPADAQPGDTYSYPEVRDDGQLMIVEVTVVDVEQGRDRLEYLLAKNSIQPQTVSVDELSRIPAAANAPNGELGVYVVSDPEQIRAALEEANQQRNLFMNVRFAGVIATAAEAAQGEADRDTEAERVDQGGRTRFARDPAEQLQDRSGPEAPVAPQARMAVPAEFSDGAAAPMAAGETPLAQTPRAEAATAEPPPPAPAASMELGVPALADAAELADDEAAQGYQQIVNVSRAAINEQLRQGRESLARQNAATGLGTEGAGGGGGFGAGTNLFYMLPNEGPELFGNAQQGQAPGDQKAQAQQQARRKLRMLVLLQADPVEALKARADAPPQPPVEAPLPARKKG